MQIKKPLWLSLHTYQVTLIEKFSILHVSDNVEQLERLYIGSERVKWYNSFGKKNLAISFKINILLSYDLAVSLFGISLWETFVHKRLVY